MAAVFLRIDKLTQIPPSISWDEAAVGYNAWTIANYGQDEYGKKWPIYFRSFADDKRPIHIYITAISEKFLGLNEFATRLPAAVFGILNVIVIYFLANQLFKNHWIGTIAATFLAISPYAIQFSRFNHELNFTIFFFMFGLLMFLLALKKWSILLILSFLSFGLSILAYHSGLIVVPLMVLLVIVLYFKRLRKIWMEFGIGLLIFLSMVTVIILNPPLLGTARLEQTGFSSSQIIRTYIYKQTKSQLLGRIELILYQYSLHFSPTYLFISGDRNPRHSSQSVGEFYPIDGIFLLIGLLALVKKRDRTSLLLLTWAFLAPLPASAVSEAPHAARAQFMMGSWHLIAAFGAFKLLESLKNNYFFLRFGIIGLLSLILGISFYSYHQSYYQDYPKKYAIEWQYGMKQIVDFAKTHPEYSSVYVTDERHQPYIFFLYYLKTPLPDYLQSRVYNNSDRNRSYNTVAYFNKYYFGNWDTIKSPPDPGVLYVLTPSQYGGLMYRLQFDIKSLVKYPDGGDAFFLVSRK